ncbi:hypothetical protein [Rhodoglobus sp.]
MTQSKHPRGEVEPYEAGAAPAWLGTRSARILAASIVVAIVVALGVVLFLQFAPKSVVGTLPTSSPTSGAGVESPTASSSPAPTDGPVVPDVAPIAIDKPGVITTGLTAQISKVEEVDGTARGPGEVAGPSLRVTVTITNTSSDAATLRTAVVSCYFGADRTPAQELREPGGVPLPESVSANSAVDGVYVFTVPPEERDNITILVDYSVDVSPLVFQGDAAELIER